MRRDLWLVFDGAEPVGPVMERWRDAAAVMAWLAQAASGRRFELLRIGYYDDASEVVGDLEDVVRLNAVHEACGGPMEGLEAGFLTVAGGAQVSVG